MNYDQKSQEAESKNKEYDQLNEELSQKIVRLFTCHLFTVWQVFVFISLIPQLNGMKNALKHVDSVVYLFTDM